MWGGLLFSIFYYLIPMILYKILAQQDYTINHWYRYHFLSQTSRPPGLSHPFLGMRPGPMELGKLAVFRLKLGKSVSSLCMKFPLLN